MPVLHSIDIVNTDIIGLCWPGYNKLKPARSPRLIYRREQLRISLHIDCQKDNTLDGQEV